MAARGPAAQSKVSTAMLGAALWHASLRGLEAGESIGEYSGKGASVGGESRAPHHRAPSPGKQKQSLDGKLRMVIASLQLTARENSCDRELPRQPWLAKRQLWEVSRRRLARGAL